MVMNPRGQANFWGQMRVCEG
jgi:hypothetical protein